MKKFAYVAMSLALALICLCALAACGAGKAGTYYFESMKVDIPLLGTQELKVGEEYLGITLSKEYMKIELNKDGTYSVSSSGASAQAGTWEVNAEDSDKIDLKTGDVVTATVECKDGKITMSVGGVDVTFKK